ncbi:MAG: SCO1664 family protein [Actinomycetota bacterium]
MLPPERSSEQGIGFSSPPDDLAEGELELLGTLPAASNYTFLAKLRAAPQDSGLVVYKPRRGEAPLWDFPSGTLCQREVAAFMVSECARFGFVPPTVLREGPLGVGAVQLFIYHDFSCTAFDLLETHLDDLRRIVLFDLMTNNADRKAGHVFADDSGRVWAVDHGLCFHREPKLRTVLWDFVGEPIPAEDLAGLRLLEASLDGDLERQLRTLLGNEEIQALHKRVRRLLETAVFPGPGPGRPYPWPPV